MNDHTTKHSTQEIPYGYCHCGCGQQTSIAQRTNRRLGYVRGHPVRYLPGHHHIDHDLRTADNRALWVAKHGLQYPYGECQCGCGQKTSLAVKTNKGRGCVKGEPTQFLMGHVQRVRPCPTPKRRYGENHPGWTQRIKCQCKFCHTEFERVPWEMRKKDSTNDFCSAKCRSEYRKQFLSGKNAPDYVGGAQTYRGRSWLKARKMIVDRQNGECAHCKKHVGKSLPVHHIRPFREFKTAEEANTLSNLVGLCQSCHMKLEPRPKKKV